MVEKSRNLRTVKPSIKSNMKALAITTGLILCCSAHPLMSQGSKVSTAKLRYDEGALHEAVNAIELAVEHPKTKDEAKTWYYRGLIYQKLYAVRDSAEYKNLGQGALDHAYVSFTKALQLDEKGKYDDWINLMGLDFLYRGYHAEGDIYRDQENWPAAKGSYLRAAEINQLMIKNLGEDLAGLDTAVSFLIAFCAEKLGETDEARTRYRALVDMQYRLVMLYQLYAKLETDAGNYDRALEILSSGSRLFPGNQDLMIDELNVYLSSGRQKEAVAKFEQAAENDPENAELWFALGTIYDQLRELSADSGGDQEEAKEYRDKIISTYQRTIELDPGHFKAVYNLGVAYFNDAVEISRKLNNLPLSAKKEYAAMEKERDALLSEALPYLEKAHELNPEDLGTVQALKEIYLRMKMNDRYSEMNGKLKELQDDTH